MNSPNILEININSIGSNWLRGHMGDTMVMGVGNKKCANRGANVIIFAKKRKRAII